MSSSTRSWWATSTVRGRLTTVGTLAATLCLFAVSYIVWTSPAGPVNQIGTVVEAVQGNANIKQERNELLGDVVDLTGDLSDTKAEIEALEQQLAQTQQDLAAAQAAAKQSDSGGGAEAQAGCPAARARRQPRRARRSRLPLSPASWRRRRDTSGCTPRRLPSAGRRTTTPSSKIGSLPNVVGYFGGWDEPFRADAVTRAWKRDTLPMLTWESRPIDAANSQVDEPEYTLPRIIGDPANGVPGAFDDYLHQYARDIVTTGLPLAIRFDHEMNGVWYPWSEDDGKGGSINGNSPGEYVKMWQHVHDIFEQEGANRLVIWVWAPNIVNNLPSTHKTVEYLTSLFPGDDYVDWVGLSGYLRPPYKAENDFTFEYTYGASLDQLREITDKPIFLAEVGASEVEGHKPAWITSFFDGLAKPENDDIVGFAWFNLAVTTYVEGELVTNDWRIESRPESLDAFVDGLARPEGNFDLDPYP